MTARSGALAALLLSAAVPSAARGQAGPWVPVGSRLDRLVTWVIGEGGLERVDPLTRPYRMAAVRAAAASQDTLALTVSGRRAFAWLRSELDVDQDSTAIVAELGHAFYRNGRRDSFRDGGGRGNGAMGGIWVSATRGPLVAVLNPAFENRLKDDPEFTGKTDRFIAGRLQTAYAALTGELGEVGYGRMARQWAPGLFDGLQLSPAAYATDEFWGALRVGRFELSGIAQRLDDQRDDSVSLDTPISRYFLAHRLTVRAGRGIWLAFTETGVYGGPGRGFEPAFHAPLNPALLTEFNERSQVNLLWGLQVHARVRARLTIAAEAVIDDIQVDDATTLDRRPWSGGFTLVAETSLPRAPVHASLGYTQVRSLMYRNSFAPFEVYTSRGVGIGRNFSDYDQVLLRLEAPVGRRLAGAIEASYLRQGSGDLRQPFPPDSVLAQPGQGLLVAPVARAAAVRLTTTAEPVDGIWVNVALGVDGNLAGPARAVAAIALRARFDVLTGRLGGGWPGIERGAGHSWP